MIILSKDGSISPVDDVVFSRYDAADGHLVDAFNLNYYLAEGASVTFDELPVDNGMGGETGEMIFLLAAEIHLFQTGRLDSLATQMHDSFLWHVHILYQNLNVVSSVFLSSNGKRALIKKTSFLGKKYNNVEAWRNEFGLGLRVTDTGQGADRELYLHGKGATCEKYEWKAQDAKSFYSLVLPLITSTNLNPGK